MPGATHGQQPIVGGLANPGHLDPLRTGEVLSGEAFSVRGDRRQRALRDDLAPLDARPWTEVDDVVRGAHRVLVMFDDDHGVADVAQAKQSRDQAVIVSGMKTNGRLVQNIENPHQPGANLRRQADSLRLAPRERRRRPFEAQIVQAHVDKKPQTPPDLLQEFLGDRHRQRVEHCRDRETGRGFPRAGLRGCREGHSRFPYLGDLPVRRRHGPSGQRVEPGRKRSDRHGEEFGKRAATDPKRACPGVQSRAAAVRAGHRPHVRFEHCPGRPAVGVLVLVEKVVRDAVPGLRVRPASSPTLPAVNDDPIAGAVEPGVLVLRVERVPGALQQGSSRWSTLVRFEVGGDPLEKMPAPSAHLANRPERFDSPVPDRLRRVRHESIGIEIETLAEPIATGAHSLGAVETEQLRAGQVETDPATRAGVVGRQDQVGPAVGGDDDRPLAPLQSRFDGLAQPATDRRADLETVDHDFNVMLDLSVEGELVGDRQHLTIHPRA